jgi:hypothetical protein
VSGPADYRLSAMVGVAILSLAWRPNLKCQQRQ